MEKFYIVLGDWSGDGHSVSEKVLIESDIPVKDLQIAYKASCKATGLSFNHNETFTGLDNPILICTIYEDNQISEDAYYALKKLGCPFNDIHFKGIGETKVTDENFRDCFFDKKSFLNLFMWFISLSINSGGFKWSVVNNKIPIFNGYFDKDLNVQIGYGLYT